MKLSPRLLFLFDVLLKKTSPIRSGQRSGHRNRLFWACMMLGASLDLQAQRYDTAQHRFWGTAEGLPQSSVHAIAQTPDGFLWVATEAGLARFDGNQFVSFSPDELGRTVSEDLCCLAVDGGGVLWIGSSFGIAAISGGRTLPLPDRSPFTRTPIHSLSVKSGHVIAESEAGAFSLDLKNTKQIGPASVALPLTPPILKDRIGNLWFGSTTGLNEIPAGENIARNVGSLKGQTILSLFEDLQGTLWVGTETTGLHRFAHSVFATFPGTLGVPVASVAWSAGGVLLGTRDGDLRLISPVGDSIRLARFAAGITVLATSTDAVWAGTTDGLYRVDAKHHTRRYTSADGLPDDYIRSLATSTSGDVWVGTAHGLAHLTASRFESLTAPGLPGGDLIGPLLPARTTTGHQPAVWAATEGGLLLFAGSQVTEALNVTGSPVAGIVYDQQGALWFATQDGSLWQRQDGSARKVLQLPMNSLRQAVQALYVDREDTLWIVLHDGLLSASIKRLAACVQSCSSLTSLVSTWGIADGMPSTESLIGGFGRPAQDDRGNLLFATRAGVAVADPAGAARTVQVPVVIARTAFDDRLLDTTKRLMIPYGRTRLTVDYEGIALSDPARVRYRMRLVGFDPDWVETGVRRTATYTALPPGEYQLQVQGTLEGQPWPDAFTSLSFEIAPPFYRRWWFLFLAGLLLLGAYVTFYQIRLSAERRRFALVMAERNRLAREVHDTLAQDLVSTGIQLDVILFALKSQTHESATEMLKALRRSVGQALAEARESIGELRNPNFRVDLESRLRRMVERKSTATTPVSMEIDGLLKPLTAGIELELLRIAAEAVENAVRHANAIAVMVRVHSAGNMLEITVADNGRGFVPTEAEVLSGHYGLRGMRERAEAIGATLAIDSESGNGTNVMISVGYR